MLPPLKCYPLIDVSTRTPRIGLRLSMVLKLTDKDLLRIELACEQCHVSVGCIATKEKVYLTATSQAHYNNTHEQ